MWWNCLRNQKPKRDKHVSDGIFNIGNTVGADGIGIGAGIVVGGRPAIDAQDVQSAPARALSDQVVVAGDGSISIGRK